MTEKTFKEKYSKLSTIQKKELKNYYNDVYKNAIFPETLTEAEKRLTWIAETEK